MARWVAHGRSPKIVSQDLENGGLTGYVSVSRDGGYVVVYEIAEKCVHVAEEGDCCHDRVLPPPVRTHFDAFLVAAPLLLCVTRPALRSTFHFPPFTVFAVSRAFFGGPGPPARVSLPRFHLCPARFRLLQVWCPPGRSRSLPAPRKLPQIVALTHFVDGSRTRIDPHEGTHRGV